MNDLLVIAFPSEQKAEEVREKLLAMQKEYLIELGDAVVAVKKPDGNIKLNQLVSTTALGGASGAFWGSAYWADLHGASGGRRARRGLSAPLPAHSPTSASTTTS